MGLPFFQEEVQACAGCFPLHVHPLGLMAQHLCILLQFPLQLPWFHFQQYSRPAESDFAQELLERLPFPFGLHMLLPLPFTNYPFFLPFPFPFGTWLRVEIPGGWLGVLFPVSSPINIGVQKR